MFKNSKKIIPLLLFASATFSACIPMLGDPIYVARGQVVNENGEPLNDCELLRFYFKDGDVKLDHKDRIPSEWIIYGLPPPESADDFFIKISCGNEYYEYYSGALGKFHLLKEYYYDLGVIAMKKYK